MRDWQKLNQKQKKALIRRVQADDPGLEVVHTNADGIDVGNSSRYVAGSSPVFAEDSKRLAQWLVSRGIQTVAMQSAGVYWIPLCDILEESRGG